METIIGKFRELLQIWTPEPINLYIVKLFAALIGSLLTFRHHSWAPLSTPELNSTYDFVIIGGGTAGIVLASTLVANYDSKSRILLIEAGSHAPLTTDIPYFESLLKNSEYDWNYVTEPQMNVCNGYTLNTRCRLSLGKMMGGSTLMESVAYTTGTKRDWNRWKNLENPLWGWDHVSDYFKKFLTQVQLHSFTDFLGHYDQLKQLREVLFSAAHALGFQKIENKFDSLTGKIGYGKLYGTLENGKNNHPGQIFLKSAIKNNNLHVLKQHLVTKLKIDPETKKILGIEYTPSNQQKSWEYHKKTISVKKEVILCAGAINNAKLLMLSGVGPREHLEERDIFVIENLSGVGKSLQDHIVFPGIFHMIKNPSWPEELDGVQATEMFISKNRGPFSSIGLSDIVGYLYTPFGEQSNYPNVRINHFYIHKNFIKSHFFVRYNFDKRIRDYLERYNQNASILVQIPMLLKPQSRGRIFLKDNNPFSAPLIYPQYLTHQNDLDALIRAAKHAVEIGKTEPMKNIEAIRIRIEKEFCPNSTTWSQHDDDDDVWKCLIQIFATSANHFVGTTRMAHTPQCHESVVNEHLQVHGVKNLRVADASVMPEIIAGDLYASNIMIAQRAAEFIIQYDRAGQGDSGDFF